MDAHSQSNVWQSGLSWRLRRAQPELSTANVRRPGNADAHGPVSWLALHGLRQRAAEACGLPAGGIHLTAATPDPRRTVGEG